MIRLLLILLVTSLIACGSDTTDPGTNEPVPDDMSTDASDMNSQEDSDAADTADLGPYADLDDGEILVITVGPEDRSSCENICADAGLVCTLAEEEILVNPIAGKALFGSTDVDYLSECSEVPDAETVGFEGDTLQLTSIDCNCSNGN